MLSLSFFLTTLQIIKIVNPQLYINYLIYLEENRKEAGQRDRKDEVDTKGMDYCFLLALHLQFVKLLSRNLDLHILVGV